MVVLTILKKMKVNGKDYISHILWKIKDVRNHQPANLKQGYLGVISLTNHDSSEDSEVVMKFTQIDVIATFNVI